MGPFAKDWDEATIEAAIARDDPSELLYVPIMVGMNAADFDSLWVQDVCVKLAGHPHFNVRANAMLGFGHIARTRRVLDLVRVAPIISAALLDSHPNVRDHANSAACDLEMFLGFSVPGYDGETTVALGEAIDELRRQHAI